MRRLPISRRGEGRGRPSGFVSTNLARRRGTRVVGMAAGRAPVCSEWLEPRLLLAAHTWVGAQPAGLNQLWSFGPNWIGGAPGASEADVVLVFPPAGVQKILTDDILSLGQVDAIIFTGSGYVIGGNNSTIHLNAQGATYNIDDQAGGNILGDAGLTIAMIPSEFARVQTGRLNINARL